MTKKSPLHEPHTSEFSRRAVSYTEHNIIQKQVVQKLLSAITSKPAKILDLGSGCGAVYDLIDWKIDTFTGIDKATKMCALHPKGTNINILDADFENRNLLQTLGKFDIVISSSALQWAKDLDTLFATIATMTDEIAFAIFCDGTFKTIYKMTDRERFLPSYNILLSQLEKYFDFNYEKKEYKLYFKDNLSKFRYIKNSGVSGGQRVLNYQETKKLIREYPLEYLEFEVLFVWGKTVK